MGHIIDITAWRAARGADDKRPATIASPAASTDALDGVLNAVFGSAQNQHARCRRSLAPCQYHYAIVRAETRKVAPVFPAQLTSQTSIREAQ